MTVEIWEIAETMRFRRDVAHYGVTDSRVDVWRSNIQAHPLIGDPVGSHGSLALFDYEVEDFIIRYLVLQEQQKVQLMVLRRRGDDDMSTGEKALDIGKRGKDVVLDIARLVGLAGKV
jgi:hypothetical protein